MASYRKSITAAGTIRWQAVWTQPAGGGTTKRRTKNFATAREARAFVETTAREIERRGVGDLNKYSFAGYLTEWLDDLTKRDELSPATLSLYRRQATIAAQHLGHIPLEKLSPIHFDGLYTTLLHQGDTLRQNGRGPKARSSHPNTIRLLHRILHIALARATKQRLIRENPTQDATAPAPRPTGPKAFTEEEVDRLLTTATADRELYTMIVGLFVTGMRRSELLGLALDAVDFEAATITIKRTVIDTDQGPMERSAAKSESSIRTLGIPSQLVDLLREQRARVLTARMAWGQGYRCEPLFLFAQPDGAPQAPESTARRFRRLMRDANVHGRPPAHAWRHTAATFMIGDGADIKTVQKRLGHSTASITLNTYVHSTAQRDREAGESLAARIPRQTKA